MDTAEEASTNNEHEACPHCQGLGKVSRQKAPGARGIAGQERAVSESPAKDGWLTMQQAADKFRCGYFNFSRNWRAWGLHPTRFGKFIFEEKELDDFLRRNRVTYRGRPKKQKGEYAEG